MAINGVEFRVDSLLPPEMAKKAEAVGVKKAAMPADRLFMLGILAGAFIGLGAVFATVVATGGSALPYGVKKVLIGLVFCLGLILVIVGGAELFTGNNLIMMAWAHRRITTKQLLYNWAVVYLGNFVGSVGTAILVFLARQYMQGSGGVGLTALTIANAKCNLDFIPAVALGTLCNAMVCMAVWLTLSARTTTDKIMAILFPIAGFVAAGFEHSVANMYFISEGLFIKMWATPDFWEAIGRQASDFANLTWGRFFLGNLLPVTIGNIIGGGILVAMVYWFIFLRDD